MENLVSDHGGGGSRRIERTQRRTEIVLSECGGFFGRSVLYECRMTCHHDLIAFRITSEHRRGVERERAGEKGRNQRDVRETHQVAAVVKRYSRWT